MVDHTYTMTNTILGRLRSSSLRKRLAAGQTKTSVHLQLWTERHSIRIKGECRGITVYNVTVEKILPIVIEALKTAGYTGTWRAEDPPLTTQLLETMKSFDPVSLPKCHKCGEALQAGDRVTSIPHKYGYNIYHESCYQSTLH